MPERFYTILDYNLCINLNFDFNFVDVAMDKFSLRSILIKSVETVAVNGFD